MSCRRRRGQRGQALIETAIVIAVLFSLLTGAYAVSEYASDQNTAGSATRAGARLGAELGNASYGPSAGFSGCQLNPKDPCAVDRQIVQVVCQIAATMPFVQSILEIDVYRPVSGGDGSAGDLYDRYSGATVCTPGSSAVSTAYTLDQRVQIHPNESYLGVSLRYQYKSPTPIVPIAAQPTVYTVVQESPKFT